MVFPSTSIVLIFYYDISWLIAYKIDSNSGHEVIGEYIIL